ncbi:hypothetical protein GCM10011386_33370 [Parapedobacter defluvii]|uniref:Transposase (putative) YhgA-like domain-containing protein n=1 Tax=Parapedobacter defluvii TaxID=2045106 RepID=A0ABQ1MGE8_9SPHI|nr:hypothetical protein [Parapedobacter defluvii]GGC38571.1 hypothetical protein GCM10011386_33370 [Parapedobacter defluvii]
MDRTNLEESYPIPRKKNDIVTKAAFMEWFIDLLRFLYPNADEIFDLGRGATAMEKELLEIMPDRERIGGTLLADMLMKVYLQDGTEQWLLIHVELEGQSKDNFAKRLWRYYVRLTDRYPVPIIPVAIFTGGPKQKRPTEYHFAMLGSEVIFRFRSYHVFEHTEKELLANPNPMALVILACQAEAQEAKLGAWRLNEIKKRIVEELVKRDITDTGQIMRFIRFLNNLIYLKDKELNLNFVKTVERLTKGAITMNIMETLDAVVREEGKIEGKIEGKTEEVRNLIQKLGLSDEQAADVAEVSVDFVQKVRADLDRKKK